MTSPSPRTRPVRTRRRRRLLELGAEEEEGEEALVVVEEEEEVEDVEEVVVEDFRWDGKVWATKMMKYCPRNETMHFLDELYRCGRKVLDEPRTYIDAMSIDRRQ